MLELLMELLANSYFQLSLLSYVVVYGIAFGVSNYITRIHGFLSRRYFIQSELGRILDSLWITSVVLLVIANY